MQTIGRYNNAGAMIKRNEEIYGIQTKSKKTDIGENNRVKRQTKGKYIYIQSITCKINNYY